MARPSKLTPATEAVIIGALRDGCTRTAAFESAGIARSKISIYMRRFGTFRDAVIAAEAEAQLAAARCVRRAVDAGGWRAAAWWLERRHPDEWGRRDRLDVVASVRTLAREYGLSPDEEREAVAEALRILRETAHEPG